MCVNCSAFFFLCVCASCWVSNAKSLQKLGENTHSRLLITYFMSSVAGTSAVVILFLALCIVKRREEKGSWRLAMEEVEGGWISLS